MTAVARHECEQRRLGCRCGGVKRINGGDTSHCGDGDSWYNCVPILRRHRTMYGYPFCRSGLQVPASQKAEYWKGNPPFPSLSSARGNDDMGLSEGSLRGFQQCMSLLSSPMNKLIRLVAFT